MRLGILGERGKNAFDFSACFGWDGSERIFGFNLLPLLSHSAVSDNNNSNFSIMLGAELVTSC